MQGLGSGPISFFGTDEQRQRYLPRVATGELVAAFALTEPHTGSDAAALSVTAVRDGDSYVLNGTQDVHQHGAGRRSVYGVREDRHGCRQSRHLLLHRREGDARVRSRASGCRCLRRIRLASRCSRTAACPPPIAIGEENAGFKVAMGSLDFFRTTVGACAVGFAQRALDESRTRLREEAARLRQAHRRVPGHSDEARRNGDRARGGAAARVSGRADARQRPEATRHARERAGEALRHRSGAAHHRRRRCRFTAATA